MNEAVEVLTRSPEETESAAERLGRSLAGREVVLLYGELGAGKTAFVRGLARGLGAPAGEVSSPTFTLVQEYAGGRVTLYHADLYRLQAKEVEDLGLDELAAGGVLAIEWAERWRDRPEDAIEVRLEHAGPAERRLLIRAPAAAR